MRKLIYYVASTVDGFIARENGAFDCFLSEGEHFADLIRLFPETLPAPAREALGIDAPNQQFDAVLMGRKTYEVGQSVGLTNPYPQLKQYLFSQSLKESPDETVELVTGQAAAKVRELKQADGKDIWLCGGGALAKELFPEIDELILKINPVIIGRGIPLFRGDAEARLEMIDSKSYGNGFKMVNYRIKH